MSEFSKRIVTCPRCGAKTEITVWESINTGVNPEMREKIFNGEAFVYECAGCGRKTQIDFPFLYHQPDEKIMIYYLNNEYEYKAAANRIAQNSPVEFGFGLGSMTKSYRNRIVLSINDLMEKVYIFEKGLDDRVIEIIKVLCYNGPFAEKFQDTELDRILFVPEGEPGSLLFYLGKNIIATAPVTYELYDQTAGDFGESIEAASKGRLIFDYDWADNLLEKEDDYFKI